MNILAVFAPIISFGIAGFVIRLAMEVIA